MSGKRSPWSGSVPSGGSARFTTDTGERKRFVLIDGKDATPVEQAMITLLAAC